MHNKKVKFLSILCATVLVGQSMPISAEDVTVTEEGTQSVVVTANVSPDYIVTIPKTLTLDREGTTEYTVTASGEIEKLSTLTVTPDDSFILTTKYDSATAEVSQEKTSWSDTDLLTDSEKTTTGSIAVEGGLAPGDWSGTFNFEIALNEHAHEYSTTDGTTHTCSICNTSGEHDYDEGTITTEATCTAEGVKTFKCTSCDESYTEAISMTDHKDENSDTVCDVCGELVAGLYNEEGVMTSSWDELLDNGTIHVTEGVLKTNATYPGSSNSSAETLIGKLIIDDSVTSLNFAAFSECRGLTSIKVPDSVTSIGDYAFYNCDSLTSITIPSSVTSIGECAFGGCSGLDSITVDTENTVYDSRDNCNAIIDTTTKTLIVGCKNTVIPDSVTSIGDYAFCVSDLTSITIPDSVTSIGYGAFEYCDNLINISIPDSVTSIGDYAFCGCSSLTNIDIPDNVTNIGEHAFEDCTKLTGITIPDSVTSIGNNAFCGCTGLMSIDIPDSVTSIGVSAFYNCSNLTSIVIPDSVTSIGVSTFYGCSNLTSITIPSSVTSIGERAFQDCGEFTIDYKDAEDQWNAVTKGSNWDTNSTITMNYTE